MRSTPNRAAHRLINLPRNSQLVLHVQLQPILVLHARSRAAVQLGRLLLLHSRSRCTALAAGGGPQAAASRGAAASGGCHEHVCTKCMLPGRSEAKKATKWNLPSLQPGRALVSSY